MGLLRRAFHRAVDAFFDEVESASESPKRAPKGVKPLRPSERTLFTPEEVDAAEKLLRVRGLL